MPEEPRERADDQPWNDSPADSGLPAELDVPEPAEVEGEEGEEWDASSPRMLSTEDEYRRETLDERLAEEEPEARITGTADPDAGELVDPDRGGGDVQRAERHGAGDEDDDEMGAEDAAMHVVDEDRI